MGQFANFGDDIPGGGVGWELDIVHLGLHGFWWSTEALLSLTDAGREGGRRERGCGMGPNVIDESEKGGCGFWGSCLQLCCKLWGRKCWPCEVCFLLSPERRGRAVRPWSRTANGCKPWRPANRRLEWPSIWRLTLVGMSSLGHWRKLRYIQYLPAYMSVLAHNLWCAPQDDCTHSLYCTVVPYCTNGTVPSVPYSAQGTVPTM